MKHFEQTQTDVDFIIEKTFHQRPVQQKQNEKKMRKTRETEVKSILGLVEDANS